MANVEVRRSSDNGQIFGANRCVVRSNGNKVYVFLTQDISGTIGIKADRGNVAGEPSSFLGNNLNETGMLNVGCAAAKGSDDIAHIAFYRNDTSHGGIVGIRYVPYNMATNTFGTVETVATITVDDPQVFAISICVDDDNEPHVTWRDNVKSMGVTTFFNYYSNRISGVTSGVWDKTKVEMTNDNTDSLRMNDVLIGIPTDAVGADRPILMIGQKNGDIAAYHGNALDATAFTVNINIASVESIEVLGIMSMIIDSDNRIVIAWEQIISGELMIIEHLPGNAWGNWETEIEVDNSVDYVHPSIATNDGPNLYVFVEDDTNSDINMWKDEGSGFSEETADADLPNVGTFDDVKAKWASKNIVTPTQIDYVFQDSAGAIQYNTVTVPAFVPRP